MWAPLSDIIASRLFSSKDSSTLSDKHEPRFSHENGSARKRLIYAQVMGNSKAPRGASTTAYRLDRAPQRHPHGAKSSPQTTDSPSNISERVAQQDANGTAGTGAKAEKSTPPREIVPVTDTGSAYISRFEYQVRWLLI